MTELIVLCTDRTKEQIDRVVAYLLKEFPMAKDAGLTARETTEADPSYLREYKRENWLAVIENGERWSQYTATIDKMCQAAQDYENGWADAMKQVETVKPVTEKRKGKWKGMSV